MPYAGSLPLEIRKMRIFVLPLLLAVSLAACQSVPLDRATIFYDRATFTEQLQQDIGPIGEPILQHGRCGLHLATPGANVTTNYRFCTYALTEKRLFVQEWDIPNTKYTPVTTVEFAKLVSVDLASFALSSKQVKLLEPQRLVAISASIDDGGRIDGEATEIIFNTVKAQGIPSTGNTKRVNTPPAPAPASVMIPIFIPRR
jgi:hypothetical protein